MVARLNNDTMQYYRPPADVTVADDGAFADALCEALFAPELTAEEAWEAGAQPLLRQAKAVLGDRLAFAGEDDCILDGRPVSQRAVVEAANAVIRATGGRYLSYPGLRPRPERVLAMRIRQQLPERGAAYAAECL
jgi:hypothetical protein